MNRKVPAAGDDGSDGRIGAYYCAGFQLSDVYGRSCDDWVAIGGFWSMSAATAIRLVPQHQVTRALAIFNAGNALATVVAAPLGSYLGATVGWRGAFLCPGAHRGCRLYLAVH